MGHKPSSTRLPNSKLLLPLRQNWIVLNLKILPKNITQHISIHFNAESNQTNVR